RARGKAARAAQRWHAENRDWVTRCPRAMRRSSAYSLATEGRRTVFATTKSISLVSSKYLRSRLASISLPVAVWRPVEHEMSVAQILCPIFALFGRNGPHRQIFMCEKVHRSEERRVGKEWR